MRPFHTVMPISSADFLLLDLICVFFISPWYCGVLSLLFICSGRVSFKRVERVWLKFCSSNEVCPGQYVSAILPRERKRDFLRSTVIESAYFWQPTALSYTQPRSVLNGLSNKKLSCRRETARCFVSLNSLLTHSRFILNDNHEKGISSY